MRDLTQDSIVGHLFVTAVPIAFSMVTQVAYHLINLYFVTQLGPAATAGMNIAGNVSFVIGALTQVLAVGTSALLAQAVGRWDQIDANLVFNQAAVLSVICGIATMTLLYALSSVYLSSVSADEATIAYGASFLYWVLPGYALMFPWTVVGAVLRSIGIVRPTMVIYSMTLVINALLAPVLIAGWITGVPLGIKGAGLATTLSVAVGLMASCVYFARVERYLSIRPGLSWPLPRQCSRILTIGLPAGAEFALIFLSTAVAYYAIRQFGPDAQAGLGIGSRVLQATLLPGMAIAFAAGPIIGQNFGANHASRVNETFYKAALCCSLMMAAMTVALQCWPELFISAFEADTAVIAAAVLFLQVRSWSLVAQGLVYTCTNTFQGLGNTLPALIGSVSRFLVFCAAALWLAGRPQLRIEHVWYLWVVSVVLQAVVNVCFTRVELRKRLASSGSAAAAH